MSESYRKTHTMKSQRTNRQTNRSPRSRSRWSVPPFFFFYLLTSFFINQQEFNHSPIAAGFSVAANACLRDKYRPWALFILILPRVGLC